MDTPALLYVEKIGRGVSECMLSGRLFPRYGQLTSCSVPSCFPKVLPALSTSAGVPDGNEAKFKYAPHDSHIISSISTFIQPFRAQANELATLGFPNQFDNATDHSLRGCGIGCHSEAGGMLLLL
ncbi:hypothetical protein PVL29_026126 [Vitis rotundifolia]|uniref:Uncharacterized protein n=1 Tax=Vitis rotundifolia TaxID=103349 RepID=A0AA39D7D0_VITRO|nr:hypothetical protein PVL29_026126 [Vitis rotundifolia]